MRQNRNRNMDYIRDDFGDNYNPNNVQMDCGNQVSNKGIKIILYNQPYFVSPFPDFVLGTE